MSGSYPPKLPPRPLSDNPTLESIQERYAPSIKYVGILERRLERRDRRTESGTTERATEDPERAVRILALRQKVEIAREENDRHREDYKRLLKEEHDLGEEYSRLMGISRDLESNF